MDDELKVKAIKAMMSMKSFCRSVPDYDYGCGNCPFREHCEELSEPPCSWDIEASNKEEENEMPTTLLGKDLKEYTDTELDVLKEKLREISEQIIKIKEERRKNKRTELVKQFKNAFTNLQKAGIEVSVYRKLSTGLIDCINFDEFSFDDYSEN